jgi:cyclopropane fatty-acyl-phospholipid synthase-like methyltransferase
MQLVSISFACHASCHGAHNCNPDYPRTLREWGRRLEANLTQDVIVKDYPALRDIHEYAAFKRKWEYLFAYAGAGFAKGYITCHMLTFIRQVSSNFLVTLQPLSDRPSLITERYASALRLISRLTNA